MKSMFSLAILMALFTTSAYGQDSTREENLAVVEEFLNNEEIALALESQGKDPVVLMKKVRKLKSWPLKRLSHGTKPMLYAASSADGASAERISTQWLNFANKWLMIGVIGSVLLILMLL